MGDTALIKIATVILVPAGARLLTYSIVPAVRVISKLSAGKYLSRWVLLVCFIIFFSLCYFALSVYILNIDVDEFLLLAAAVLLLFAIFILLVCNLTLDTGEDLANVDRLQKETITDGLMGVYNRRLHPVWAIIHRTKQVPPG